MIQEWASLAEPRSGIFKLSDDTLLRQIYDEPPTDSESVNTQRVKRLRSPFAQSLIMQKRNLRDCARITKRGELWLPTSERQKLAMAIGKATPIQDWSSFGVRVMLAALVLVMSLAINSAMSKSFSRMSKKLGAWLYAVVTMIILSGFILIVTFLFRTQRMARTRRMKHRTGVDFRDTDLQLVPTGGTTRNLLSQFYTAYRA
jgi:uncharacterized membrane protein